MALFMGVNSHVKDVSFANIFWRKLSIRLIALFLVSSIILFFGQSIVGTFCDKSINTELTNVSLQLAQLADVDIPEDKFQHETNVILAKAHERIGVNRFIVDTSLSLYNMRAKGLVTKSFEIPVVYSDELIDWWKTRTKNEVGTPMITLSEEMIDFYYEHESDFVYIEKIFCINNVLCPMIMTAKDESGKSLGSCNANIPSIETVEYVDSIRIKIIGNRIGDKTYGVMANFVIKEDINDSANEADLLVNKDVAIVYDALLDNEHIQVASSRFVINQIEYQVDCGYQSDFWTGAWKYVMVFEVIGILMCGVLAFINTKETLAIYG